MIMFVTSLEKNNRGNCYFSETLKLNLQKLQNRTARVITGDNYDVRLKQILLRFGWKNWERRQKMYE